MRIFGLEITRAPKVNKVGHAVWSNPSKKPLGVRVVDMTPDELRYELLWVLYHLKSGGRLYMGKNDKFQRILVDKE